MQVIKRHPGNEAVLTAATRCLAKLAVDATNATIIGDEGGVTAVLESMAANQQLDEEVLLYSLHLIDKMCNHTKSLETIVTPALITNICRILEQNADKPETVELCTRILEKMTRTRPGLEAASQAEGGAGGEVKSTVVKTLLKPLRLITTSDYRHSVSDTAAVINIAKLFLRLLQMPRMAARLREVHALEIFLDALRKDPDEEKLTRVVAKLLMKLMDGGISELVAKIKSGGLSAEQQERLLQLLSALAVDSDLSEEITDAGGVAAVVNTFESKISARAKEEIVRMIMRLATSAKNLDEILASGALPQLVAILAKTETPVELKGLVLHALNKISAQARTVAHVVRCDNAIRAALSALERHSSHRSVARQGLAFVEALVREKTEARSAIDLGHTSLMDVIKITIAVMRAQADDDATQLLGTRALTSLLSAPLAGTEREVAIGGALNAGLLELTISNLDLNRHTPALVKESILLLTTLSDSPSRRCAHILAKEPSAFDAVVAAVHARPDDRALRKAAIDLVSILSTVDDSFVSNRVFELKQLAEKIDCGAMSEELAKLPLAARSMYVIAIVPSNLPKLSGSDAVRPLVSIIGAVAVARKFSQSEEVLCVLGNALLQLLPNSAAAMSTNTPFPTEAALKAAIAVVKAYLARDVVVPALKLIDVIVKLHVIDDVALKAGVVETCTKAMMNVLPCCDPRVIEPASSAIYSLATLQPQAVADRNGQKACIAALEATPASFHLAQNNAAAEGADDSVASRMQPNVPLAADDDAAETRGLTNSLRLLDKISSLGQEQARRLAEQGAVSAVFFAMDARADDTDFVAQCKKTLRLLVSDADAHALLSKIADIDLTAISRGEAEPMRAANRDVCKLGLLMLCGESFAELIRANRGPETLAAILKAAITAPKDTKTKANLVRGCIEAFGRAAGHGLVVPFASELSLTLGEQLRTNPSVDVIKAIAALAGDPAVCISLVGSGCVETLLLLLNDESLCEPVLACLLAIVKASHAGDRRAVNGNVLPFLCEYMLDQLAAASADRFAHAGAMLHAVRLLPYLVEISDSSTVVNAGTLRVLEHVLDVLSADHDLNRKHEIEALCTLMTRIAARHPGEVTQSMVASSAHKLMQLIADLAERGGLEAELALNDTTSLLGALADDPDTARTLAAAGGQDVLIAAMNSFPNNIVLATSCASALSKIVGAVGGLNSLLEHLEHLALECYKSDNVSHHVLGELAAMAKLAANLVLQNGVVADQQTADAVANTARRVVEVLYTLPSSDCQQKALAGMLILLSRLMNVGKVVVPDEVALACSERAFREDMGTAVQAAACALLNSMCARGGTASVTVIASRGVLASVQSLAMFGAFGNAELDDLRSEATSALRIMLATAVSNAPQLAAHTVGAQALAQILADLHVDDLNDAIDQICSPEGGPHALLEALAQMNAALDFEPGFHLRATTIVRKLLHIAANVDPNQVVPWKIDHVTALCKAKRCLLGCDTALSLHLPTLATGTGAALCFGGYEPLFNELVIEDLTSLPFHNYKNHAITVASLVAKAVSHAEPTATNGIIGAGVPRALVSSLTDNSRLSCEHLVQNVLYALSALAHTVGVEGLDLPKDTARIISDAMRSHPNSEYVQQIGAALLVKLRPALASGVDHKLKTRLAGLSDFHGASTDWQQVASTDGVFYFNATTGVSTWGQPDDYLAFVDELDAIAQLVDDHVPDVSSLRPVVLGLASVIKTHGRDARAMCSVLKILNAVGTEPRALDQLTCVDGLENIVCALEYCERHANIVLDATELLSKWACEPKIKARLALKEYIRVINQTALNHMASVGIVKRCFSILANLAYNNAEVIAYEMELNVPCTLKWALQHHVTDLGVCEMAIFSASCLLTEDEQQKMYICDQLTREVVDALKLHLTAPTFFSKATRCLGSMSLVDRCIVVMTSFGVVTVVVAGIDSHLEDANVLRSAIELLSNFGAIENESLEEQAIHALIEGGSIQAIRRVLNEHSARDAVLLISCFDALYNVGNDERAGRIITDECLCEVALHCLDQYDFQRELSRQCVRLISVLTYNEISVRNRPRRKTRRFRKQNQVGRLSKIGAATSLLDTLGAHAYQEEFVVDCTLSLSNLVTVPATARAFLDRSYLKDVLDLLDASLKPLSLISLPRRHLRRRRFTTRTVRSPSSC